MSSIADALTIGGQTAPNRVLLAPMSGVSASFFFVTAATPRRIRVNACGSPRRWHIIAADRIIAIGFAAPFPAMSGADPWTASNTAACRP